MENNRYKRVKAEWMVIKKDLGTFGFLALIISMFLYLFLGITTLCKTMQMKFSIQEIVILYNMIFFVSGIVLIGFLYIHVLKIKNPKFKLK